MTRPTLDLARLRAVAEKATQGPRVVEEPSDGTIRIETRGRTIASVWAGAFDGEPAFLSRFDREVCLALLDRLEALECIVDAIASIQSDDEETVWHLKVDMPDGRTMYVTEAAKEYAAALPGKAP